MNPRTLPGQRVKAGQTPGRVALYLRLSVADLQRGESVSEGIKRQRDDVLAVAARYGVRADARVVLHTDADASTADVVVYIEDGESAWKRRQVAIRDQYGETRQAWRVVRPVWGQMMRDLRADGYGLAIVYNSDRLARDEYDMADVIETAQYFGIVWDAASGQLDLSTDDGRTMARILAAMNAKASADTSRRVERKHIQRVEEGRPNWRNRPFGHRVVRDEKGKAVGVEIVESEAEAIRSVVGRLIEGTISLAGVAREWDSKGVRTASGGTWSGASERGTAGAGVLVGAMLRQARLAGFLEYRGEIVGRSEYIPAILDEGTWRDLVRRLDARVRTSGAARRGALLTGKDSPARCGECNGPLTVANLYPRKGAEQKERFLKCVSGHVFMHENEVEIEVLGRAILAADLYGVSILPAEQAPDLTVEQARLGELNQEINMYRDALVTKVVVIDGMTVPVTAATVLPTLAQLEREQSELQRKVDAASAAERKVTNPDDLRKVLREFGDLDLEHRRAIVARVYSSIVVHRRYDDQADDSARVATTFVEGFIPEGAEPGTRPVFGAFPLLAKEGATEHEAVVWRYEPGLVLESGTHLEIQPR